MSFYPQHTTSIDDMLIEAIQLQQQDRNEEAISLFRGILATAPSHPAACYSLAVIELGRNDAAAALRLCETGICANPNYAPLHLAHGAVRQALGQKEEALKSYDEALRIQPDSLEALTNSGVLLRDLFRHSDALERFNRILAIDPNSTQALVNSAILLAEFRQSEHAIAMLERALELDPNYDYGLGLLCYERLHICDWKDFDLLSEKIVTGIQEGRRACKTLALMAISDSAEVHFEAAKIFAAGYCPRKSISLWRGERYRHEKIRIAYVSPDLREHPVGHLMAGIFEHHDKARFETIAISLGVDDNSRLRQRMVKAFDHFIDAHLISSLQIAEKMRELEVDIAIDLAGYTSDARPDIFAYRPAPIQAGYLGYPGTTGTDYMDYIIADRHVIPEEHRKFYTERVLYLPDAYLPTDSSIVISEHTPTREDCGLPGTGFVFCSFSHDYKISPHVFAIWMRLLAHTPGSVLWLMSRGDTSMRNLRLQAARHGIDPNRLIFANRLPRIEDHLARYRQADLFLDTHPYNAHTTAADALFAGVPVITYMGNAFPARVAASLLQAIGLSDLITSSFEEYEDLARHLAAHPDKILDLKRRLRANKSTHPLFDTAGFCRNLEALYQEIWRNDAPTALAPAQTPPTRGAGYISRHPPPSVHDDYPLRQHHIQENTTVTISCLDEVSAENSAPRPPLTRVTTMARPRNLFFFNSLRSFFPAYFHGKKILEIGSLDINGSVRIFFQNCDYLGIDLGPGPGVDQIFPGQDFPGRAQEFDVIISSEVFEHTDQWDVVFLNMLRMLKRDGLLAFTCASFGRPQHGTSRFDPAASPLTSGSTDYYRNLVEADFMAAFRLDYWFARHALFRDSTDLHFVGLGMRNIDNLQALANFKLAYDDYLYKKNILGLPHEVIVST